MLDALDVPAMKIASFEIVDPELIAAAARSGRPLLISTGMATLGEVEEALRDATAAGAEAVGLMQCTSVYPAPPERANLRAMATMRDAFGVPVGLSDHTTGIAVPIAAAALGAAFVEKHFTLDRTMEGWDHAISSDPAELRAIVEDGRIVHEALGSTRRMLSDAEIVKRRQFRRSLVTRAALPAGHVLTRGGPGCEASGHRRSAPTSSGTPSAASWRRTSSRTRCFAGSTCARFIRSRQRITMARPVYVVHCIDTEGPAPRVGGRRPSSDSIPSSRSTWSRAPRCFVAFSRGRSTWGGLEGAVQRVVDPHLLYLQRHLGQGRRILPSGTACLRGSGSACADSGGNGWIYNWFCVDHVDYDINPRRRDIGFHNVFDHYRGAHARDGLVEDGLHFHYHPHNFRREAHRVRATHWSASSDSLQQIISRRVIERQWFPAAHRAGLPRNDPAGQPLVPGAAHPVRLLQPGLRSTDVSGPGPVRRGRWSLG